MGSFAAAQHVWPEIKALATGGGQKKAAVAYVSSDHVVKFGRGDLLVCDASIESVRNGLTSAEVLKRAIGRGARVVSFDSLHAKVLLFGNVAVIGSTNISMRSAMQLCEAVVLTRQRSIVQEVSAWIDRLAGVGTFVNQPRLEELLAINVVRGPITRRFHALAEAHIVFFKQVMHGDIEKYKRRSSTAGSGGGARDLRIPIGYRELLAQILSEATGRGDTTCGPVLSQDENGEMRTTQLELWPPTKSRPNEIRLARFYDVPGWAVSHEALEEAESSGDRLFYVLEVDIHGTVTAKVLSGLKLGEGSHLVDEHIRSLASRRAKDGAITGAVDVLENSVVP